jgi:hypothetical protein
MRLAGRLRASVAIALVCASAWTAHAQPPPAGQAAVAQPAANFASLIERLSEPGGDFGGDNLISNEQSYLHVLPALEQARVTGGAYLGVGPDQNFSYIAATRPAVAFIIDIRRDNLLLHLLFKAIFANAPTRVEYLCLLTGRPAPPSPQTWQDAPIDQLIAHVDRTAPFSAADHARITARLDASINGFGVPLSASDLNTIHTWHRTFISAGLSLVFQARGRPPQSSYPSYRDLLRETDRNGRHLCFLASEPAFRFMRGLEARDLVIPVVGDVSGPKAMAAIAANMTERGTRLSSFYLSNVEFYLYRDGSFGRFVENLKKMPRAENTTMIRSVFPGAFFGRLPQSVPGYYSTSLTQPLWAMLADLAAGRYRGYSDLVLASAK